MITGKSRIGVELSKDETNSFKTFNPIENKENEWTFYEASSTEIAEACALAKKAFPTFRATTNGERAQFLRAIADEIEALGDQVIEVYQKESGLPEGRARGEKGRTLGQLRSFADFI